MMKAKDIGNFGTLAGDFRIPAGVSGSSYIKASAIGKAVKSALRLIPEIHPSLKLYQYALMPDHLHVVIAVGDELEEALGRYLARFKRMAAGFSGVERLFEPGFNDQILYRSRSLDTVCRYLRENPRRLAVRRAHPEFFRRVNCLRIGDASYQAYGNFQLLESPFREQVVVHRADSSERRRRNRELWLHTAANGGVLVSPFISRDEKEIRALAEDSGGRLILVTNERMGDRYKPCGRDFGLCEDGRLLIVSTGGERDLTREACLAMNSLAERISGFSESEGNCYICVPEGAEMLASMS